jgi:hypothetical protein
MTTTSTQTSDLTVQRAATQADAQLLVSMMSSPFAESAARGMDHLYTYENPPTYEQFHADHPHGSSTRLDIIALLNYNETLGTFVKQGLLARGLVYDLYWISGGWERCRPIALGFREAGGNDQLYENFEALAVADR